MALSAFYDSFALDCFALGVVGGLSGVKTILRHLRKHKANFFTSFFWQFPENFGIGFTMIPSRSFQPRIPPKIATRFYFSAAARIYPWLSTVQGRCKCYDARSEFGSLEHMGCENRLSSLS